MPSEAGPSRAKEVLDFWFGREGEPGYGEFREAWFREDPRHTEIIERFGRFPHRNEILGRETTPEEAEFLEGPNSSF